jgi:ATP/maltotriose-dependent transcriptional regulator MalT
MSDPVLYLVALESHCEALIYLGQADAVLTVSAEAIRVADEVGNQPWSLGMRNYQAMGLMLQGDLETALQMLEEADVVLGGLDEHFMRPWNLAAQAMIAMMQDRVADAIDLQTRQVKIAEEAGYVRTVAIALEGLGGSYAAAGDLEAASDALLRSLDLYEQMGLVVEVAGVVVKIAGVRAAMSAEESAVELLASVLADPVSSRTNIIDQVVIGETASATLGETEERLDPKSFAAAHAHGAAIALPVMVKELLAESR